MITHEQLFALPLVPCTECSNLESGICVRYERRLPFPDRPCRCVYRNVPQTDTLSMQERFNIHRGLTADGQRR